MLQSTGEMLYNPYKEFKRGRRRPSAETPQHPSGPAGPSTQSSTSLNDSSQPYLGPPLDRSHSEQSRSQKPHETAGNMVGATLQGFGKFSATYFKGVCIDIPHAAAEGFRRAPRLYGEQPKDYGTVTDWKSGMKVGGKNFVGGMTGGVAGMIREPLKGALEEGRPGAVRGLARGALGMATKMPSGECCTTNLLRNGYTDLLILCVAGIGLMAYPFHGISKSIEAAFRTKTPKEIVSARLREGYAYAARMGLSPEEVEEVIQIFDALLITMDV